MKGFDARKFVGLCVVLLCSGCESSPKMKDAAATAIAAIGGGGAAASEVSAASFDGGLQFRESFDPAATEHSHANAYWMGRAAELAYLDADEFRDAVATWGVTCRFVSRGDTQAHVLANDRFLIVAFRGTETNPGDLATDGRYGLTSWAGPGRVHRGFHAALEIVWADLLLAMDEIARPDQTLWFTGHSLGGALAVLGAMRWSGEEQSPPLRAVYTYGQPMVGDEAFVAGYETALGGRTWRYVNHRDLVPQVPLRSDGYGHAGALFRFDGAGGLDPGPDPWAGLIETALADPARVKESMMSAAGEHGALKYVESLRRAVRD